MSSHGQETGGIKLWNSVLQQHKYSRLQQYLVAYLRAGMSSHPTRLGLPVVTPYSRPTSRIVSASFPKISVGYGPEPTLVVYALAYSMCQ
jgi:hypothetical protein